MFLVLKNTMCHDVATKLKMLAIEKISSLTALTFCGKKGMPSIPNVPRMCHKTLIGKLMAKFYRQSYFLIKLVAK